MAKRLKCDYCGKIYYKDGFMNELGEQTGVGSIVDGVRGISRLAGGGRNFCSTACKNAYSNANGGSGGGGGGAADFLGLSVASQKAAIAEIKQKEAERMGSLQDVVSIRFGDDPQEIFLQMQTAETYFEKHKQDNGKEVKALLDAISQKMDEGVYKLKSVVENEEDYYYKQAVALQQKFKKKALKKKRSTPYFLFGFLSFALPIFIVIPLTDGEPGGFVLSLMISVVLLVPSIILIRKIIK